MAGFVGWLEGVVFRHRVPVLAALAVITAVMAWFGVQLRMEAGFEKQMPAGHEYVKTFTEYRDQLFGANRLTVVVKARNRHIWNREPWPACTR